MLFGHKAQMVLKEFFFDTSDPDNHCSNVFFLANGGCCPYSGCRLFDFSDFLHAQFFRVFADPAVASLQQTDGGT